MKYYVWELNEERKEIIFNKSESNMADMRALSEEQFKDYVGKYPDYNLVDLESIMVNVFDAASDNHPDGKVGLVNMLMRGFH